MTSQHNVWLHKNLLMFTLYWIALPSTRKAIQYIKGLVYHLSHDCHFDSDCDVSTAHCRSSSGDSVDLLSQTTCLWSKHSDQYQIDNRETYQKLNPLYTLSMMIDIFHDTIWYNTSSNGTELEHTHWKSCRSGWLRGFGSPNPDSHSWIFIYLLTSQWFQVLFPNVFSSVMVQIPVDTTLKCGAKPTGIDMWCSTFETSTALLCYRNHAEMAALMCEQKPFLVWLSCLLKSYLVQQYTVNIP